VCTEMGEIMLLENSGEYIAYIQQSPLQNFKIQCILPYQKGFIIGGESGEIIVYEKVEDQKIHYIKRKMIQIKLDNNQTAVQQNYSVTSMVLQQEETLYLQTGAN